MFQRQKTVLLVEDNTGVAEMLKEFLGYAGILTKTAYSIEDAIRIIDEEAIRQVAGGHPGPEDLIRPEDKFFEEMRGEESELCEDEDEDNFHGCSRLSLLPRTIDAILLDGSLHKELDSLQVLQRVKYHELKAPVIAISGNPESNRILCRHGALYGIEKSKPSAILGALLFT